MNFARQKGRLRWAPAVVMFAAITASAQTRTPEGRPDLQGLWLNNTATPLERPAEFAGKTTIQVASFLKQADGSWKFYAVGAGSNAGLGDIIQAYLG